MALIGPMKFGAVTALAGIKRACPPAARSLSFIPTRPLQVSSEKEASRSVVEAANEVKKTAEAIREKVNGVTADQVAGKVIEATQEMCGRAKQKAQEALSLGKVKEAVVDKAEGAKEAIRDAIKKN